ncbi:hypothetical protein Tco_0571579 [Tanacetum coccineum]
MAATIAIPTTPLPSPSSSRHHHCHNQHHHRRTPPHLTTTSTQPPPGVRVVLNHPNRVRLAETTPQKAEGALGFHSTIKGAFGCCDSSTAHRLGLSGSDMESDKEMPLVVRSGAQDEGQAGPDPGKLDEGYNLVFLLNTQSLLILPRSYVLSRIRF